MLCTFPTRNLSEKNQSEQVIRFDGDDDDLERFLITNILCQFNPYHVGAAPRHALQYTHAERFSHSTCSLERIRRLHSSHIWIFEYRLMISCLYYIQSIAYRHRLFDYHMIISLIFLLTFQFTEAETNFIDSDFVFLLSLLTLPFLFLSVATTAPTISITNHSSRTTDSRDVEGRKKGSG